MRWADLLILLPAAWYQLAAFLFAALFHYLCALGHLSLTSRYIFLLAGGCLLAGTAMGSYATLLLIPAVSSVLMFLLVSPAYVHTWVFSLQMCWQTLCHLGLGSLVLESQDTRPAVTLSAIMLLTQKVTSLAMDIHEGTVLPQPGQGLLQRALPLCSYLLFFPALLGGPLCSFSKFQAQVMSLGAVPCPLRAVGWRYLGVLVLQVLRAWLEGWLPCMQGWASMGHMWAQALLFRLAYYSQWVLDEALLEAAGFGAAVEHRDLSGHDLWTLETTHRLSVFSRTWNRSTSLWLRRLVFQRCPVQPLLATFAFSAWWHGLRPGQIFGFLCWAIMVEADYRIHPFLSSRATSCVAKLLYRGTTWVFTQLIIAYIQMAVETESFSMLCLLWTSYNSILPLTYGLVLLLLLLFAQKPKQNRACPGLTRLAG
ncbi:ghrelin O-acyltransferase [Gallus gallus]|uniref:Membrane bound O-acyltransferase domain containing 4 n=1 Tax=Gallus gallus TaxID=9031 RepID=A0A8V0XGU5_CHICK|nr:ghrelin O-acyltransferase [Gallus gallus]